MFKGFMMVKKRVSKPTNETTFVIRVLNIVASIYLVLMCSFYFLFPGFHGYVDITEDKWRLFCALSTFFIGITVILIIQSAIIGSFSVCDIRRSFRRITVVDMLVLGYLAISAVSVMCSDHIPVAFFGGPRRNGYVSILLYCLVFLIISKLGTLNKSLPIVIGTSLTLNNILCLLQFAGTNPFAMYPDGLNYYDANILYGSQFLGTLGNNDLQSAAISLFVPMFICILFLSQNKNKYYLIIPVITSIAIIIKAEVTAGIIALILTLLFVPIMIIKNNEEKRRYVILLIAFILILTILLFCFGKNSAGTVYEISMLMHGNIDESYGSSRIYIWKTMLGLVKNNVMLGIGPDTIELNTDAVYTWFNYELNSSIDNIIDNAHNEYLEILVGQGCIALLIYLVILTIEFIRWISHRNDILSCALGLGIMGYCIQAFFGINSPITTPYLWIALGLLDGRLASLSME